MGFPPNPKNTNKDRAAYTTLKGDTSDIPSREGGQLVNPFLQLTERVMGSSPSDAPIDQGYRG